MKCRVCKSSKLKRIFSLGKQPLANNLPAKKLKLKTYPLDLYECTHCTFIQLGYVVDKKKMYDKYFYIPSVSKTHLKHFTELAGSLILDCKLKKYDLVVDIGSSDGSLLKCFDRRGMEVYGIEPARNIEVSVPTYRGYFNNKAAERIVNNVGKAKLVTATNSFAHIDNLDEYFEALDILLDDDGIFFAQFPDVRNLLKENQFDTIYHEHLSYFTYESLHHLFATSKFELFRIDESDIHGGSMRIYVRRRKQLLPDFIENSNSIRTDLRVYLWAEKAKGKKIAAFGAAAKGVVLLNACELDSETISYVVDGTPYKQGKYIPGMNIPIYPEEHLLKDKPDIVLILAWNFKDEIMEKLKGRGYKFIVPIPEVKTYE